MIRKTSHTLKFATAAKKEKLDKIFAEYARVVNAFIQIYWVEGVPRGKANSSTYKAVDSWLMGKARKCAGNQAVRILKSVVKKDKQKTYDSYKRVYAKAKERNENVCGVLSRKWSEWSLGKTFRHRVSMPVFNGDTVDLNSDLVRIQDPKTTIEFDLWIRIGSVLGGRKSLILPTKHHKRSRRFQTNQWSISSSICLRKSEDGQYYADLFWEKENVASGGSKVVGVDIGINKLISTSTGECYGETLKSKLDKLNRRKQNSKNWNQTRAEIKDYIGRCVNEFSWDSGIVVMENIVGITRGTRGRVNKAVRKMLGHWNIALLYRRMSDKAEENRVLLAFVEPAYTSQTCNSCGNIDKKSRNGESFVCTACGHEDDADINGAKNIRQRFLSGHFTVARGTKVKT